MALDPRNLIALPGNEQTNTEFIEDEFLVDNPVARHNYVVLRPDPQLIYRKIYFFLEVVLSTADKDFLVRGYIHAHRGGRRVAELPASIAKDATSNALSRSVACLSIGAASPVADGLRVCLSKKFTGGYDNVVLTPSRIAVHCDQLTFDVAEIRAESGVTVDSLRAYLAVISSNVQI